MVTVSPAPSSMLDRAAQRQPLLADAPVDDDDRRGAVVVVVEAGVVPGHPADDVELDLARRDAAARRCARPGRAARAGARLAPLRPAEQRLPQLGDGQSLTRAPRCSRARGPGCRGGPCPAALAEASLHGIGRRARPGSRCRGRAGRCPRGRHRADRAGAVRGGLVEAERVVERPLRAGPPRAAVRSACSGARPASSAKITRRRGSCRPHHGVEGVPGGVLLGHVVGGRRPPGGCRAGGAGRTGPDARTPARRRGEAASSGSACAAAAGVASRRPQAEARGAAARPPASRSRPLPTGRPDGAAAHQPSSGAARPPPARPRRRRGSRAPAAPRAPTGVESATSAWSTLRPRDRAARVVVAGVDLEGGLARAAPPASGPGAGAPAARWCAARARRSTASGHRCWWRSTHLHAEDHSLFCIKLVENMGFASGSATTSVHDRCCAVTTPVPSPPRRPMPPNRPPSAVRPAPRRRRAAARQLRAPLQSPGKTSQIEFVSTSTSERLEVRLLPQPRLPLLDQRLPDLRDRHQGRLDRHAARPLWVADARRRRRLFDANGNPQPPPGTSEESAATCIELTSPTEALTGRVGPTPPASGSSSVSMCNHDIYGGGDHRTRTTRTHCPTASRARSTAVRHQGRDRRTRSAYPTGKVFLHGGSAGSAGVVLRGLGHAGRGRAAGSAIADSGSVNRQWEVARAQQTSAVTTDGAIGAIAARLHPGSPARRTSRTC